MTRLADPTQRPLRLVRQRQTIDHSLVLAQPSLLAAIKLCISAAGFEADKQVYSELDIDAGHWSRILRCEAHFPVDKLPALMELCGNDAPLIWLVHARGFDPASLRRLETDVERELRAAREQLALLQAERDTEHRLLRQLMGGRVA